jgi:hypothetical protein
MFCNDFTDRFLIGFLCIRLVIMNKLLASDGPETTEQCLKDLNGILVKYNNGIPSGVKKIEMVKQIRSMKYVQVGKKQKPLPTWSKGSEIAYQVCDLSPLFFGNYSVIFFSMSSKHISLHAYKDVLIF